MLKLDKNARLHGEPVRYVAMGDSFTEGVGDVDTDRPNQVRGWADRVAETIGSVDAQAQYANLAIRGLLMHQIVDQQLEAALELRPNLVSFYGGGNDIISLNVNIDEIISHAERAFAALRAEGIEVLTITGLDVKGEGPFARTRPRTALYNELLRTVADEYGVHIIDYWRMDDFLDWRLWADDRLHMNELGHQRFAYHVLTQLELGHLAQDVDLIAGEEEPPPLRERVAESAYWVRTHALPWMGRQLTGRSLGDGLSARYPNLVPAAGLGEPVELEE